MSAESESREERLAKLRGGMWVRYTHAEHVLAKIEDIYSAPRSHRMPSLLLFGETNNGKTMIVRRFHERHQPSIHFDAQGSRVPVLMVQAPPVPDESRFYNAILTELYSPFRAASRVDQKQLQVQRVMESVGVRVLIIDEIHHVLAGTAAKQRHFLNVLKYLSNELQISIIAVGTREALNAIHADPQLANRFEPVPMPRWRMDEEFIRLLKSLEATLSLGMHFSEPKLAERIFLLSEGTIGEVCELIRLAALHAIRNGSERITEDGLQRCGYTPPSMRRRPAEV